jgi:L-2-hydroxyglutarate oxidase LhgO
MGIRELRGSLSRDAFAAQARRYVPEISAADLVPAPAGVRAQALDANGALIDDFRISRLGPVTTVRNARGAVESYRERLVNDWSIG